MNTKPFHHFSNIFTIRMFMCIILLFGACVFSTGCEDDRDDPAQEFFDTNTIDEDVLPDEGDEEPGEDEDGDEDEDEVEPDPLNVTPTTAQTTAEGEQVVFNASGGTPPYSWKIISGPGSVAPEVGDATVFTRANAGVSLLECRDDKGKTSVATIENE